MRIFCIAALAIALIAGQASAVEKVDIKSDKGKRSYSIGYDLGNNVFKKQGIEVDSDMLAKGMKDSLTGKKPALTDQQMTEILMALQKELLTKRMVQMKEIADKNKKDGDAFLADNKTKPGITTLPNGIQYKISTEGKGDKPKSTSTVKAHYIGKLIDGTEFDNSYKRGEPSEFDLDKVIVGWREVIPMMAEGSKWQVFIPSDLAYGEQGRPPVIPQNSVLIFDVELVKIVK
jgi:FKBP-type peptidyl-prolyl cis-trans isomerase FklB